MAGPWPDLTQAFSAGVAARTNVEKLGMMRQQQAAQQQAAAGEADQRARLMEARRNYQQGNKAPLQQLAPKEFQAAEASAMDIRSQQQSIEAEEETRKRKRALEMAKFDEYAMTAIQKDPDSYPQIAAVGRELFPEIADQIGDEPPTAEEINESLIASKTMRTLLEPEGEYSDAVVYAADRLSASLGRRVTPQEALDMPDAGQHIERHWRDTLRGKAKGRGVEVTINDQGVSPLATTTKGAVQKNLIENEQMLSDLDSIDATTKPSFLGFKGKAGGFFGSIADRAGVLPMGGGFARYVEDRSAWRGEVGQLFNKYRKFVTGAAAAEKELQQIKDVFINEELGENEWRGRSRQLRELITRSIRLKRKILRDGGLDTDDDFKKAYESAWADPSNLANDESEQEARAVELEERGMPAQEVIGTLLAEGYITEQEADAAVLNL